MGPGARRDTPDEETTDWRAVCGKTARTVRRAGRVTPSRPLSRRSIQRTGLARQHVETGEAAVEGEVAVVDLEAAADAVLVHDEVHGVERRLVGRVLLLEIADRHRPIAKRGYPRRLDHRLLVDVLDRGRARADHARGREHRLTVLGPAI